MSRPSSFIVKMTLVIVSALCAGCPDPYVLGPHSHVEVTDTVEASVQLDFGGTLNIDNISGSIIVVGTDRDRVDVVAVRKIDGRLQDAQDVGALLDDIEVLVTRSGTEVTISVELVGELERQVDLGRFLAALTVDITVLVPSEVSVSVDLAVGEVGLNGLTGDQRINVAIGEIAVKEVDGAVTADVVVGKIEVNASTGVFDLKIENGDIAVSHPTLLDSTEGIMCVGVTGTIFIDLATASVFDVSASVNVGGISVDGFPFTPVSAFHGERLIGSTGEDGAVISLELSVGSIELVAI